MKLDRTYWNARYEQNETGWDAGAATTPLRAYLEQLTNKSLRILIPGCGKAHEGELAWKLGFKNITLMDVAPAAKEAFLKRVPDFPKSQFVLEDFFEHNRTYDLILEQTFFCALHPTLRMAYAEKMHQLLAPNGKLVGVLFNFPLTEQGPPFGGSAMEYHLYLDHLFDVETMETCYNSIGPRAERELFLMARKRN